MAERMNFEEFCNRVVQEINQEKALGESVASYEDKKIRVTVLFCKLNDAPVVTLNDAITV